jgi:hypothetical protein
MTHRTILLSSVSPYPLWASVDLPPVFRAMGGVGFSLDYFGAVDSGAFVP